jgi:hypothetical protein
MNNQEREVITDIFRRLEQAANQPRDPDAERLIADQIRQQPYAPYAMAQTIFVQEQALMNLQTQLEQLRGEVEELRRRPQASGGFLSGLFGGGRREEPPRHSHGQQPSQPWGGQPGYGQAMHPGQGRPGQHGMGQPGMGHPGMGQPGGFGQPGMAGGASPWGGQARGGSGFLGSALTTAAGVAGGMMIASALTSAFQGGGEALGAAGEAAAGAATGAAADAGLGGITDGAFGDATAQPASFGGQEDFGADGGDFDLGGGDDY